MALATGFWLYDIALFSVIASAAIYAYFKHRFQYWQKRGIPVPLEPCFPEGNYSGFNRTRSMFVIPMDMYNAGKGLKVIGSYMFAQPQLLIRDMELAKNILVKDFSSFHDRGIEFNTKNDPLAEHLFMMNGQEWRNLRIKMTPTFTSGKMKMMFPTMLDVGIKLKDALKKCARDEETEVKEILARYTTDVIGSVAFGIEVNSMENPDVEFRKIGIELTKTSLKNRIMSLLFFAMPALTKLLPFSLMPKHITSFFLNAVQETMDYRQNNNINRNDFMQLLLQLKTLGYIKDADNPEQQIEDHKKFTLERAAAQAFIFFFAGFETTSATMQFALYEMAVNPDIQTQLQRDLDDIQELNKGQLTYESVMTLDILDRVVDETLRKYPPTGLLMRKCNKEYPVPETDLVIQPGDAIFFPLMAYHYDADIYPEPQKFDPDRFLPEAKSARPHCAYLPFGEGPRSCIANRFALMQVKVGLATILSNFTVSPSKKTPIPMEFDPKSQMLAPKGKMHLKITKRVQ